MRQDKKNNLLFFILLFMVLFFVFLTFELDKFIVRALDCFDAKTGARWDCTFEHCGAPDGCLPKTISASGCTYDSEKDVYKNRFGQCFAMAWCSSILAQGRQLTQVSCYLGYGVCQCEAYGPYCQVEWCQPRSSCRIDIQVGCPPITDDGGSQIGFSISINPSMRIINQGDATFYDIIINSNLYSGNVDLTLSGCPTGGTNCSFNDGSSVDVPANGTVSKTLIITNTAQTPIGNYTLTVTGAGAGVSSSVNAILQVNPAVSLCDGAWKTIPGTGTIVSQPVGIYIPASANSTYRDTISVVMRGAGNEVYTQSCAFNSGSPCTWAASWSHIQNGYTTDAAHTYLSANWNIVVKGTDGRIYRNTNTGSGWLGWQVVSQTTWPWGTPSQTTDAAGRTWQFRQESTGSVSYRCGFNLPPFQYTLTVNKSGTGSGTVISSPSGINCGSTCQAAYSGGTSVTLTATPATGSTFAGWSGSCSSSSSVCGVVMTQDRSVTSIFNSTLSLQDSYVIFPTSTSRTIGQTQQFTGLYDPDGPSGAQPQQNVTNQASWNSSNTNVATINNSGLATCRSSDSTIITSVYQGLMATANLSCVSLSQPPPPPSQTHLECNSSNQCVSSFGPGPNRCSKDEDCGINGSTFAGKCVDQDIDGDGLPENYCVNQKCDPNIPGDCVNSCRNDLDCKTFGTQTHFECYNNACVIVGGFGQNNCFRIGQGCRINIREIIPRLNPPSIKEFLQKLASVMIFDKINFDYK